jgi:hypothetical protein
MFLTRGLVAIALVAVCLDSSSRWSLARAEDPPAEAEVKVEDDKAEASPAEAGEGESADEDAKGQQFVDSAKELQEKLGQLKALLDAKGGDGADPALKERLSGLEDQLKSLGLDGLTGGGAGENSALTEFLSACLVLSMRRVGVQRQATLSALRKLASNKLLPAEAAKVELWRMVGVCVADFTEEEYNDYKAGKMKMLPKAYVDASKKPEAEEKVVGLEAAHWEELRKISEGLHKELVGDTSKEKLPVMYGVLAMVPFAVGIGFLAKLYMNMNKEKEEKAKKKEQKKSK